jgi:pyruvate-ferredoxin/flavodoxin oxidoreductase
VWDAKICIQCGLCSLACPHATIRMKAFDPALLKDAPASSRRPTGKGKEYPGWKVTVQVAPDDCTGCGVCVDVCPAKDKSEDQAQGHRHGAQGAPPGRRASQLGLLPHASRRRPYQGQPRHGQGLAAAVALFEFSGACAGCGETPYIKLMTQFFGDRMMIGNATGCSSIYGGNLPCTPYTVNNEGKGPAWSNSLFEDNAEFGLGMRLGVDQMVDYHGLLRRLAGALGDDWSPAWSMPPGDRRGDCSGPRGLGS